MALTIIVLLMFSVVCSHSENSTFVPTENWKEIKEGESIPAGLHVRVNLQTGKKEAKLLADGGKQQALIPIADDEAKLNPDEIKEALKKIKGENINEDSTSSSKFRSYEEIKKEFDSLNIKITTDLELLTKIFKQFEEDLLKQDWPSSNDRTDSLLVHLLELENLLHQYDNAVDFATKGGFQKLVVPCLSESNDVRIWALRVLGTSVQNNPRVQRAALDSNCLQIVLKLLSEDINDLTRNRAIFALSCLLRGSPLAHQQFLKNSGINILSKVFDDELEKNEKSRLQIVHLLSDMLAEAHLIAEKKVLKGKWDELLNSTMMEQGWCQRAAKKFNSLEDWLGKPVNETVQRFNQEKVDAVVTLLNLLTETCLADFVINLDLVNSVNHAIVVLSELTLHDLDEGVSDSSYLDTLNKLQTFRAALARSQKFNDEL